MGGIMEALAVLLRTAQRTRADQGGGDPSDDADLQLRIEDEEEELDIIEEEGG